MECLTPRTSVGKIIKSGYKGMGGVPGMQIDVVISDCFIIIQIQGTLIHEWELRRNKVVLPTHVLSEKQSQSCPCFPLPFRLRWRWYYCRMVQGKQEKLFYAVNWSVQMKMSAIAEDDWVWWPVKFPMCTAWSNAIVCDLHSFAVSHSHGSWLWFVDVKCFLGLSNTG